MTKRRWIVAATMAALTVAVGTVWVLRGAHSIDANNPVQVERGRQLYSVHCAKCHGDHLQGEADWQVRKPSGELPAPPHDASGHSWHHTDDQLYAITKHGMARYAPPDYKSAMPSFVGKLTDDDIRAVIAFIKSTWPEDIRRRQDALNRK
jgi:mono/diheme cytochrome c family protein